jgi:hypothetical protein
MGGIVSFLVEVALRLLSPSPCWRSSSSSGDEVGFTFKTSWTDDLPLSNLTDMYYSTASVAMEYCAIGSQQTFSAFSR